MPHIVWACACAHARVCGGGGGGDGQKKNWQLPLVCLLNTAKVMAILHTSLTWLLVQFLSHVNCPVTRKTCCSGWTECHDEWHRLVILHLTVSVRMDVSMNYKSHGIMHVYSRLTAKTLLFDWFPNLTQTFIHVVSRWSDFFTGI